MVPPGECCTHHYGLGYLENEISALRSLPECFLSLYTGKTVALQTQKETEVLTEIQVWN